MEANFLTKLLLLGALVSALAGCSPVENTFNSANLENTATNRVEPAPTIAAVASPTPAVATHQVTYKVYSVPAPGSGYSPATKADLTYGEVQLPYTKTFTANAGDELKLNAKMSDLGRAEITGEIWVDGKQVAQDASGPGKGTLSCEYLLPGGKQN